MGDYGYISYVTATILGQFASWSTCLVSYIMDAHAGLR